MKKRNILMIATLLLLTTTGVKAGEKKRTLTHEATSTSTDRKPQDANILAKTGGVLYKNKKH